MSKSHTLYLFLLVGFLFLLGLQSINAQGVTTSTITGIVKDTEGNALP